MSQYGNKYEWKEVKREAIEMWRQEWGEDPHGPLYGRGDTLEERWNSLSQEDRDYYISYIRDEFGWGKISTREYAGRAYGWR